jgi:peroxiredoxin
MKKLLSLVALLPAMAFAQSGFTVSGKVEGLANGTVTIATTQDSVIAKGTLQGGAFTLKGSVPEPGLYWLVLGEEQPQHIYLENKPITISGSKAQIKQIKIEGSQSHKDFIEFRTIFNPMVGELNALAAQIQREGDASKRDIFLSQYDSISKKISSEVGRFVSEKRSSFVSPFLLFVTAELNDDVVVLDQRYQMLDESVRNSKIGRSLKDYIAAQKIGAVGFEAMDFTQSDPTGKPVSLSSFKGKYVLVDFWASWCKPCRYENPTVVKAYKKFNDKNFTVLGVSLDQEKEAWLKAIEKDGLTWTHVSDLQAWDNEVAKQYRIESIPFNFLVDPQGRIVAKNLRGPDLEAKLCELLGCN